MHMRSRLILLILLLPLTAAAEDRWVEIGKPNPPLNALLLNVGKIIINDYGNRVATIRSVTGGGYRMDAVTEFDCRTHRQRSISTALTDKDGNLISAGGAGNTWFGGKDAIGLDTVCNAPITNTSPDSAKQPERGAAYTISTFKNGQRIGTRKTEAAELRNAATALTSAFQEHTPSYDRLVSVAKGMTARDRCFNLYSSRVALASIEAGMLDASQNAKTFFQDSISSIEAENSQTQITCNMR